MLCITFFHMIDLKIWYNYSDCNSLRSIYSISSMHKHTIKLILLMDFVLNQNHYYCFVCCSSSMLNIFRIVPGAPNKVYPLIWHLRQKGGRLYHIMLSVSVMSAQTICAFFGSFDPKFRRSFVSLSMCQHETH